MPILFLPCYRCARVSKEERKKMEEMKEDRLESRQTITVKEYNSCDS